VTNNPIRWAEAENLRQSETEHAGMFGIFTIVGTVVVVLFVLGAGWLLQFPWDTIKLAGAVLLFLGSLCLVMVIFLGWRGGRQHVKDIVDAFVADANARRVAEQEKQELERKRIEQQMELDWMREERAATPSKMLLPPTTVPLTQTTDPKLPEMIGGFDIRDIERLCEYFEHGAKWSETALIGSELPVTKEVLTPDRYKLLIDGVFVAKGVIGERDGDKRLTGKLLIKTAAAMMKAIQPAPTPLSERMDENSAGQ